MAVWREQMRNIFPDVEKGSRLSGLYQPDAATIFYQDNKVIGMITDAAFGRWFFGIWLDTRTSRPDLRRQLLGDQGA